jgi:uncharacterized OsmC-like protein
MTSVVNVKGKILESYRTEIECSHNFVLDQPKNAGGMGEGPNPLELFLSSLAGCFCALGRIISDQNQLVVRGIKVKTQGKINKSYLLGKTNEGRAGFEEIHTIITIDSDMSNTEKEKFVREIERRCPVADNVINTTKLVTHLVKDDAVEVIATN